MLKADLDSSLSSHLGWTFPMSRTKISWWSVPKTQSDQNRHTHSTLTCNENMQDSRRFFNQTFTLRKDNGSLNEPWPLNKMLQSSSIILTSQRHQTASYRWNVEHLKILQTSEKNFLSLMRLLWVQGDVRFRVPDRLVQGSVTSWSRVHPLTIPSGNPPFLWCEEDYIWRAQRPSMETCSQGQQVNVSDNMALLSSGAAHFQE